MTVERFDVRTIAPQPWKNGAGLTREIAFGGAGRQAFDWRISLAEVAHDAPFSAFPGVDRHIVLMRGAGMRLRASDGSIDHALTLPWTPFRFAGEVALDATLVDGACSDFNVMTRRGVFRSDLRCERGAVELGGGPVTFLLCCEGAWRVAAGTTERLNPMQALLWRAPIGAIHAEPVADGAALLVVRLCHDRQP